MKIIDDVKRDLRFLIESKLNKETVVQTISKLYANDRLNPESISLWYDQVRKDIPSYVQRHTTTTEPQVCDVKKSIVGVKQLKGLLSPVILIRRIAKIVLHTIKKEVIEDGIIL